MKISWVTVDRFCQDEAQVNEEIRRRLERNGRPLRSMTHSPDLACT